MRHFFLVTTINREIKLLPGSVRRLKSVSDPTSNFTLSMIFWVQQTGEYHHHGGSDPAWA